MESAILTPSVTAPPAADNSSPTAAFSDAGDTKPFGSTLQKELESPDTADSNDPSDAAQPETDQRQVTAADGNDLPSAEQAAVPETDADSDAVEIWLPGLPIGSRVDADLDRPARMPAADPASSFSGRAPAGAANSHPPLKPAIGPQGLQVVTDLAQQASNAEEGDQMITHKRDGMPLLPDILTGAARSISTGGTIDLSAALSAVPRSAAPEMSPVAGSNGIQIPAISTALTHRAWGETLSNRVVWLIQQQARTADIQINPPDLGPIKLRVTVEGDQANVSFAAQHAPVREALEAALPRLREMLFQSGLNLADASVTGEGFSRQSQHPGSGVAPAAEFPADEPAPNLVTTPIAAMAMGLIDFYA